MACCQPNAGKTMAVKRNPIFINNYTCSYRINCLTIYVSIVSVLCLIKIMKLQVSVYTDSIRQSFVSLALFP